MSSSVISKQAESASPEPWEPAPGECLMSEPWPLCQRSGWESLIPTPEDCASKLHFGMDDPEELRQTGLMRRFLRANRTDRAPRLHPLYELQVIVNRWAGERISRSTILAALEFEGCKLALSEKVRSDAVFSNHFVCWLSLTESLHAMLSAVTKTVLDRMDGALACVPD